MKWRCERGEGERREGKPESAGGGEGKVVVDYKYVQVCGSETGSKALDDGYWVEWREGTEGRWRRRGRK